MDSKFRRNLLGGLHDGCLKRVVAEHWKIKNLAHQVKGHRCLLGVLGVGLEWDERGEVRGEKQGDGAGVWRETAEVWRQREEEKGRKQKKELCFACDTQGTLETFDREATHYEKRSGKTFSLST